MTSGSSRSRPRPSGRHSAARVSTRCSTWPRTGSSGSPPPRRRRCVHSIPALGWDGALLRLAIAAALAGAVGLERELDEKAAGLRTHILVALGSALVTLVLAYGFLASLT